MIKTVVNDRNSSRHIRRVKESRTEIKKGTILTYYLMQYSTSQCDKIWQFQLADKSINRELK